MHTLVTMLGKAFSNYREATYEFEGGIRRTARFFSLELCKQIQPDKLVILGTTGSMWDNLLLETELGQQEDLADDLLNIGELAQKDQVNQEILDKLAPLLATVLDVNCELRLIPYGRTTEEQTETLQLLVDCFDYGDTATLDVTHGLRHLPMLVQQSALLLPTLRDVKIAGIYYGALDMTGEDKITPVMRLDGLLEIEDWSTALTHYDRTGDYAVFAPLLAKSGFSKNTLSCLRDAAFFEQINSLNKATVKVRSFLAQLQREEATCSRHALLFLPALKKRFEWVGKQKPYQRQTEVAWLALQNDHLLRATLYGFEAFITKLTEERGSDPDEHDSRHRAKEAFECENGQTKRNNSRCEANTPSAIWQPYVTLRSIRNQLAHSSTHSHPEVQKASSSHANLKIKLKQIFSDLIPK